jgi:uncharacterized protein
MNQDRPWWKYGYVWLVIAGPLLVVVASLITVYLVLQHPDPVVSDNVNTRNALAPALTARSHGATAQP